MCNDQPQNAVSLAWAYELEQDKNWSEINYL